MLQSSLGDMIQSLSNPAELMDPCSSCCLLSLCSEMLKNKTANVGDQQQFLILLMSSTQKYISNLSIARLAVINWTSSFVFNLLLIYGVEFEWTFCLKFFNRWNKTLLQQEVPCFCSKSPYKKKHLILIALLLLYTLLQTDMQFHKLVISGGLVNLSSSY